MEACWSLHVTAVCLLLSIGGIRGRLPQSADTAGIADQEKRAVPGQGNVDNVPIYRDGSLPLSFNNANALNDRDAILPSGHNRDSASSLKTSAGNDPSLGDTQDPTPCCVPVMEGQATATIQVYPQGGTPQTFTTYSTVAFDNDHLKAAVLDTLIPAASPFMPPKNVSLVIDYAAGWIYVWEKSPSPKICQRFQLPFGFSATCIPGDAIPVGRKILGWTPSGSGLEVDAFQIDGTMAGLAMQFVIAVTPDDCGPYNFRFWGTAHTTQLAASITFFNSTPGIQNNSVFNIPTSCKQSEHGSLDLHEMEPLATLFKQDSN